MASNSMSITPKGVCPVQTLPECQTRCPAVDEAAALRLPLGISNQLVPL